MSWKVTIECIKEETDEELKVTLIGAPDEPASAVVYGAFDTLKKLEQGDI